MDPVDLKRRCPAFRPGAPTGYNAPAMDLTLSILSAVLLAATAAAFALRRPTLLCALGAVFVPVAAATTVHLYWGPAPWLAVALLAVGLGLPLLGLALYAVDVIWAPFCVEMTYATLICWVLWPGLVAVNLVVAAFRALLRLLG